MAELFYDDDADLGLVQDRNVAVLGFGGQGAAQALSLRDSGVDVRVGLPEGSSERPEAESAGLRVVRPYEACEEADLVVVLAPAGAQRALYAEAVEPNLVAGDALLFGSGFTVRYGYLEPSDDVDVVLVAPLAPGPLVRREFEEGRGVPVLVAVDQDSSGEAWDLALSYAKAIGGTRAAAISTTFAEETETRLFGEQALRGGVSALLRSGFETLTSAGYQPEVAYFSSVQQLKSIVDQLYAGAAAKRLPRIYDVAEYGAHTSGPYVVDALLRHRLREVLARIEDGSWAADFIEDQDAGAPKLAEFRRRGGQHLIEQTGRDLRQLMSWVRPYDGGRGDGMG